MEIIELILEMIKPILWAQISIIWLLFIFQKTKIRKVVAFFYGLSLVSHGVFFGIVDYETVANEYFWYYVSGGALDLAIIFLIARTNEVSRLLGDIQDISLVSIMFNVLGMFLAYLGVSSGLYQLLYAVLYLWAIFVLFRGEPMNDGYFSVDTRFLALNGNAHNWMLFNAREKKKR